MSRSTLVPAGVPIPLELRTPDAWLRRQRLDDKEADYEAVMASRDHLRRWCDDTWP
jgi:hypothetical protein